MAAKGEIVKLHTGDSWVPAIVCSDPDEHGDVIVCAFPGGAKDEESLQADASALKASPGEGKYQYSSL